MSSRMHSLFWPTSFIFIGERALQPHLHLHPGLPKSGWPNDFLREALKKNILVEKVHNPRGDFCPSPLSMFFFYFSRIYVKFIPYKPVKKRGPLARGGGVNFWTLVDCFH